MKNKDLENYYTTVLGVAHINAELQELTGETLTNGTLLRGGANAGFNKNAFLEDVKAFTKVIVDRRASATKFDTINIEP